MNADYPSLEAAKTPRPGRLRGLRLPPISPARIIGLAAVLGALAWTYQPNLTWLYGVWTHDPDYTHGFLVIPIALVILRKRWPEPEPHDPEEDLSTGSGFDGRWLGWVLVVAGLVARVVSSERAMNWLESMTLLPVLVGLALAGLGWRTMSRVWPAFAFLLFLYPLPPQVNTALSQPLQSLATWCSCNLLRLTGLWVMPEGNVIRIGNERLEVAAACNGLSMLMSLAATVVAAASLVPMSTWKRILLLASIIPIALGSNILRISATGWCYYEFGAKAGSKYAHDAAGWLMMPTALVLVAMELAIMSWLIEETVVADRTKDRLGLSLIVGNPRDEGRDFPRPTESEGPTKPGASS